MARTTKRGSLGERARRTTERIRKKEIEDLPGGGGGWIHYVLVDRNDLVKDTDDEIWALELTSVGDNTGGYTLQSLADFGGVDVGIVLPEDGYYQISYSLPATVSLSDPAQLFVPKYGIYSTGSYPYPINTRAFTSASWKEGGEDFDATFTFSWWSPGGAYVIPIFTYGLLGGPGGVTATDYFTIGTGSLIVARVA